MLRRPHALSCMAAGAHQVHVVFLHDLLLWGFVPVPRAAPARAMPSLYFVLYAQFDVFNHTQRPHHQLPAAAGRMHLGVQVSKGNAKTSTAPVHPSLSATTNLRHSRMWTFMVLLTILLGCSAPPVASRSTALMQQRRGSSLQASSLRGRVLLQNEGTAAYL